MLKCGSMQENPLISILRKSRQLCLVTKLDSAGNWTVPHCLVMSRKVARIRRVPGSKESSNGLAPAARSSPRSLASVPPHFLDNTKAKLFGKCFLQIIPLSTQHTLLLGTNFASILQAPSFYHTLGVLGPKPPAFPQQFVRAEEAALGVSFNAQSQAPDIPGISSRAAFSFYAASLQAQSKAPDIQFLSLRASTEELLASFNAQDQAPDDPSTQDCRCVPRDFLKTSFQFRQVLSRSSLRVSTKPTQMSVDCPFSSPQISVRIPPTRPQALSRKEFDDNLEEFSSASEVVHWTSCMVNCKGIRTYIPSPDFSVRLTRQCSHKAVFRIFQFASQGSVRNFLSAIRTHLIRASGDSSFMFFVFGFDLIFKVWFVCIVLALALLGFS
jgi:hypothetical protein